MMQRIHYPGHAVEYVDLGAVTHVPLHGRATLRGHVVHGLSRDPAFRYPSQTPEAQREYKARRRAEVGA